MFIVVLKTCSFDSFIRKYIQRIVSRDLSAHTFFLNAFEKAEIRDVSEIKFECLCILLRGVKDVSLI